MRIAFIADVHANLPALEAVISDARTHGASHLLCLGDVVGYGPQPVETLKRIREIASGVLLGNHDAAAAELLNLQLFNPFAKETAERAILALDDEAKAYLRNLPNMLEVKNIACAHSCFDAPETFSYLTDEAAAERSLDAMPAFTLLVVGHTHIQSLYAQSAPGSPVQQLPIAPQVQLQPHHRYVVNPGSVGFPRTDGLTADYLIYDTLMRRLFFRSVAYDIAPYRLALVRNGYNPLNYWFLSPEARMRQTELALRNPAPETPRAFGEGSAFRPAKKPVSTKVHFGIYALILLGLLLGAVTVVRTLHRNMPEEATVSAPAAVNLLPPLRAWPLSEATGYQHLPEENALLFHPDSGEPRLYRLHSPLVQLPRNVRELRFSFRTISEKQRLRHFNVYAEFVDSLGNRKKDRAHAYKKTGRQAYSIKLPRGAAALRICFETAIDAPLKLIHPELEIVRD